MVWHSPKKWRVVSSVKDESGKIRTGQESLGSGVKKVSSLSKKNFSIA